MAFEAGQWAARAVKNGLRRVFSVLLVATALAAGGSEPELLPGPDERALSPAQATQTLAGISAYFKAHPAVRAHLVCEIDDLLGTRTEEGELLLSRPGKVMRTFHQPALKISVLDGTQLQEYVASRQLLLVKDFAKYPEALKLAQAALMPDLGALAEYFDLRLFAAGAASDKLRLVLTRKPSATHLLGYTHIQVRLELKQAFVNEVEYFTETGERVLERYTAIEVLPELKANAFVLNLPASVQRRIEVVERE